MLLRCRHLVEREAWQERQRSARCALVDEAKRRRPTSRIDDEAPLPDVDAFDFAELEREHKQAEEDEEAGGRKRKGVSKARALGVGDVLEGSTW